MFKVMTIPVRLNRNLHANAVLTHNEGIPRAVCVCMEFSSPCRLSVCPVRCKQGIVYIKS